MRSALMMVLNLWATIRMVRVPFNPSIASWTSLSLSASRAEAASSNIKIAGLTNIALAMAIRCLWPPDRRLP